MTHRMPEADHPPRNGQLSDAAKAELDVHLAEFTALREEIQRRFDAEVNLRNLVVAAVAALLAGAQIWGGNGGTAVPWSTLLLACAFALTWLGWVQLQNDKHRHWLANYIDGELRPKCERLLAGSVGADPSSSEVLAWESHIGRLREQQREVRTPALLLAGLADAAPWVPEFIGPPLCWYLSFRLLEGTGTTWVLACVAGLLLWLALVAGTISQYAAYHGVHTQQVEPAPIREDPT